MTSYYYICFIIFTVLATMIILDNNVGIYFILIFKILKVNTRRFFWMLKFHPNNFITTWIQNQKYDKIAKDLEKELNIKNEDKVER